MKDLARKIYAVLQVTPFAGKAAAASQDLAAPMAASELFLTPAELLALNAFTSIKRRRQWLGGRLAAKEALLALGGERLAEWQITNEADGRPRAEFLPDPEGFRADISISHSHDLAAALAATDGYACGIDVELVSTRPHRLRERFSSRAEDEIIGRLSPETGYTLLWCAKEALRKAIRPMPGFFDLELFALAPDANGYIMDFSLGNKTRLRCHAMLYQGYGAAVFIDKP